MMVLHLENDDYTVKNLSSLLKVTGNPHDGYRVDGHDYVMVDNIAQAEKHLNSGSVRVLILDIGLDIDRDQDPKSGMPILLNQLVQLAHHPDPGKQASFAGYRLAHLAAARRVHTALLTNWPAEIWGKKQ